MSTIHTPRLRLIAATAESMDWEFTDHPRLAAFLGCHIPPTWPPENIRDILPGFAARLREDPDHAGWSAWYWILRDEESPTLIGSGGFKGPPGAEGSVELGYGTLEIYQRRGYATEAVRGLVGHAMTFASIQEIAAEYHSENIGSKRVLAKCGFVDAGPGREATDRRMIFRRP